MEVPNFTDRQAAFLRHHQSDPSGLTAKEAEKRALRYGLNVAVTAQKKSAIRRFLEKLKSPLILLLLFASFFSALVRSPVDFTMIVIMIVISISLDTYLEHQSEKAAESLKKKVQLKSRVLRDGKVTEIPSAHLTVGDIVLLETGNVVPAELELVEVKDLHIDESTLTGESFPVEKRPEEAAYMGTLISNGQAIGVVTSIGQQTRYGKIVVALSKTRPATDFEKGVKNFGYLVMKIAVILVLLVLVINVVTKGSFIESFLFALAIAVGLTPELLPMIMTINLARGALRMANKGVIVKHLPAIHNLGSMNILCTDKTGTLTENAIHLQRHDNIDNQDDSRVLEFAYLNCSFQTNLKSPLDEAILNHEDISVKDWQKIDEIPFDFYRKRLSVVVKKDKEEYLISKGAFEEIWPAIKSYDLHGKIMKFPEQMKEKVAEKYQSLSQEGYRVLVIAYRVFSPSEAKKAYTKDDERELIFLGLTSFMDPPRHEAKKALDNLESEGVKVKILTGDNELVTQKICSELGLKVTGLTTGPELIGISEDKLLELVEKNDVFAKLTPDQKVKIIASLQKNNNVVGYLGDGVNDANSLRQADVGISVENAVDVAKETADLIMVTKSLSVLRTGVLEGRKTFVNTTKYIYMNFGSNFGNMISLSLGSIFLPYLPMLPIQIILNNLLYDFSQLALPVDNVDPQDIRAPLKWDIAKIKKFIIHFGPLSSLFDIATFVALLLIFRASQPVFQAGWFIESLATQGLVMLTLRTKLVPSFRSNPSKWMVFSAVMIIVAAIFFAQGPFSGLFEFAKLPGAFWLFLLIVLIINLALNELVKIRFYGSKATLGKG